MNQNNMKTQASPGISFVVRARNEEATLPASLQSLQKFTFPHEIIVVLHRCNDRSLEIAQSFPNTKVFEFDRPISRAGFETLITPVTSPHSIMSYCEWCFSKGTHLWTFKWDADFIATPELVEFLNSHPWDDRNPTRIQVPTLTEGRPPKSEPYLFNAGHKHSKWVFYEHNASIFESHVTETTIGQKIVHATPIADDEVKPYWREPPWFDQEKTEEALELRRKYRFLVELVGQEPIGLARDQNPLRDKLFEMVRSKQQELNTEGIYLWT